MIGDVDRVGQTMMVIRQFILIGFMLTAYGTAIFLISWKLSLVSFGLCLLLVGVFTQIPAEA